MKRAILAAVAAVLMSFSFATASFGLPVPMATAGGLSDLGQEAIADLRTCLASQDVLNVYYLVDTSRSLDAADGKGSGTGSDPDVLRAPILANSLEQLGAFGEEATVNWAAGFFSTEFRADIKWHELGEGGSAELEGAIKASPTDGYTNWPAALQGAQQQLAQQQAAQPGCQLMVWLTDGQLDIRSPDGQGPEDQAALNDMCGQQLAPSGPAPAGNGIFNALRQSGVVVIGALLATTETSAAAGQVMLPLIEGVDPTTGQTCGEQPMPEGYVNGAFVEATSPDSLAQIFLQLGTQVGGGYPHPFDADGSFWIDPGVARFRIIVSGDWTLHPPTGSGWDAASSSEPQPWIVPSGDEGVIEVATGDAAAQGRWRLDANDTRSLFLFSDLGIVFEPTNEITMGTDGETAATLVAHVRDAGGKDADLRSFAPGTFSAEVVAPDGSLTPLPDAEVDTETGAISIPIPPDVTAAEVVVEASIDPLTTTEHGLELAPITTRQRVKTVLPKDYPRVETLPVTLSTLEGRDGIAEGAITIVGPESGADSEVCVRDNPSIVSDSADRGETWVWTVNNTSDADVCLPVAAGQTVQIPVSASNAEPADSAVRASVAVSLKSATGPELTQDVPIAFTSTHPVNVAAVSIITLILLVLGILLPLILLWLLNWFTTRLDIDNSVQRASFPVRITPAGVAFVDTFASDTALSERFRYRGEPGSVRSVVDPDLGRIGTVVPWFPLRSPHYRVVPGANNVIVAARTGARVGSTGDRRPDGSVRFAHLPFDRFWAVVVPAAELARTKRGDEVRGTAVVYHRVSSAGPAQYRERLAEISGDKTLGDTVEKLRADRAERKADVSRQPSTPTAGSTAPSPPARSGTGSAAPGPGAPPSGPGAPPSNPGAPPPRPSSQPPTTPGGPPPRPGR